MSARKTVTLADKAAFKASASTSNQYARQPSSLLSIKSALGPAAAAANANAAVASTVATAATAAATNAAANAVNAASVSNTANAVANAANAAANAAIPAVTKVGLVAAPLTTFPSGAAVAPGTTIEQNRSVTDTSVVSHGDGSVRTTVATIEQISAQKQAPAQFGAVSRRHVASADHLANGDSIRHVTRSESTFDSAFELDDDAPVTPAQHIARDVMRVALVESDASYVREQSQRREYQQELAELEKAQLESATLASVLGHESGHRVRFGGSELFDDSESKSDAIPVPVLSGLFDPHDTAALYHRQRLRQDAEERASRFAEERASHEAEAQEAAEERTFHEAEERTFHEAEERTIHEADERASRGLQDQIATLINEIHRLRFFSEEKDHKIRSMSDAAEFRSESFSKQFDKLQRIINSKNSEILELTGTVRSHDEVIQKLREECQDHLDSEFKLTGELRRAKSTIADRDATIVDLHRQLRSRQSSHADIVAQYDTLAADIESARTINAAQKAEIDALNEGFLAERGSHARALVRQNDRHAQALKAVRDDHAVVVRQTATLHDAELATQVAIHEAELATRVAIFAEEIKDLCAVNEGQCERFRQKSARQASEFIAKSADLRAEFEEVIRHGHDDGLGGEEDAGGDEAGAGEAGAGEQDA
jgi:hypothetical protein